MFGKKARIRAQLCIFFDDFGHFWVLPQEALPFARFLNMRLSPRPGTIA
jgi:hypothetical protein